MAVASDDEFDENVKGVFRYEALIYLLIYLLIITHEYFVIYPYKLVGIDVKNINLFQI